MVRTLMAVLVTLLMAGATAAQAPLENFLRLPAYFGPQLSPDGEQLAVLAPAGGRFNLLHIDLATRKQTMLTSFSTFDVVEFHWVGSRRLIFRLGNVSTALTQSYQGGGLFMVSADGKEQRELAPNRVAILRGVYRPVNYLRNVPGSDDEIIVSINERSLDSVDLYRLNVRTGRKVLLTPDRPQGRVTRWLLDDKLEPRVLLVADGPTYRTTILYRPPDGKDWTAIGESDDDGETNFDPIRVDADGKTLIGLGPVKGVDALLRFDIASRKVVETIAAHPRFDMDRDSLVLEAQTERIVGYRIGIGSPQVGWIDPGYARVQSLIDKALAGTVNVIQRRPAARRCLVTALSTNEPTRYFLLDEATNKLEEILLARPWLGRDDLAEMKTFVLKTRDGLELPSWYVLPRGAEPGKRYATIVLIHDRLYQHPPRWQVDDLPSYEAQLLASRGYAVIVPNYRMNFGFGEKARRAGYGEIGRAMQRDHDDAARWAIEAGIADPQRICLFGSFYGGYAALMGVAQSPELYRCAVSGFAVTDWADLKTSPGAEVNYAATAPAFYRMMLGKRVDDARALADASPVQQAAKIKARVFLLGGVANYFVPQSQFDAMRRALEAAGNPPKTYLALDEGPGFIALDNRLDAWRQMLEFLDKSLRVAPGARRAQ